MLKNIKANILYPLLMIVMFSIIGCNGELRELITVSSANSSESGKIPQNIRDSLIYNPPSTPSNPQLPESEKEEEPTEEPESEREPEPTEEPEILFGDILGDTAINGTGTVYTVVYNTNTANQTYRLSGVEKPSASSLHSPNYFISKIESDKKEKDYYESTFSAFSFSENYVATRANALTLPVNTTEGEIVQIYTFRGSSSIQEQISAIVKKVTSNAFFLVEENITVDEVFLADVANIFESSYDKFIAKQWAPSDIDNNGKIIFLISRFEVGNENLMGFFSSSDLFPAGIKPTTENGSIESNQAELLYLNSIYFSSEYDKVKNNANELEKFREDIVATLFHEMQHMVLFNARLNDPNNSGNDGEKINKAQNIPTWLSEGLAMLGEYYAGHTMKHYDYILNFLETGLGKSIIDLDYGYSLLFMRYVQERFGDEVIKKISMAYDGANKENDIFRNAVGEGFDNIFADFTKMVIASGRGVTSDSKYNITAFNYTDKGSAEYKQNGFNMADVVDALMTRGIANDLNISNISQGSSHSDMPQYSFYIAKWLKPVSQLSLDNGNLRSSFVIQK